MPRASRHSHTSSGQDFKLLQDDALDDESSSAASFVTCPEAELVNVIQLKNNGVDDGALAEAQAISGTLTSAPAPQLDDNPVSDDSSAISTSEKKNVGQGRDKYASSVQSWLDTVLRLKPRTSSKSNTSNEKPHQPGALVNAASSSILATTSQTAPFPTTRPQDSGKIRQTSAEVESLSVMNELGYKNLAELYARYSRVQEERQEAELEIFDNEAATDGLSDSASDQALDLDWIQKMHCRYCSLYFTPEQNVRDLDNGSSPCSYHPGKKCRTKVTSKLRRAQTITV